MLAIILFVVLYSALRDRSGRSTPSGGGESSSVEVPVVQLPAGEQRLCTAVAILVDTSGSMAQKVTGADGHVVPKFLTASDALRRIVDATAQWTKTHPDRPLQLGLYNFSSAARVALPMGPFDAAAAYAALQRVPPPNGGTAIGDALIKGFQDLYAGGCVRKYIICVTDGENTSGPAPDRVARALFNQTGGEVEMHFVAFDTSAAQFRFLGEVNGFAVEAADGAQLQQRLADIYEKRILAEAMPEGE